MTLLVLLAQLDAPFANDFWITVTHSPHCPAVLDGLLILTSFYCLLLEVFTQLSVVRCSCCIAGCKHSSVSVLPYQSTVMVWQLVAYSSGYLDLPNIELVSRQHAMQLSACHARRVHVLPAQLPIQKALQAPLSSPFPGPIDNLASSVSQLAIGQSQLVV